MTAHKTSWILLVDDTEQNRYVLSRILARAGLEVEQCTTGKEALERVKSCPDLVILDVKLPDISGYEVCRRIKADPELKKIPIIVVTSYALSGDDGKAHAAGCDAYVTKPYSPRQLLAKIKEFLP